MLKSAVEKAFTICCLFDALGATICVLVLALFSPCLVTLAGLGHPHLRITEETFTRVVVLLL